MRRLDPPTMKRLTERVEVRLRTIIAGLHTRLSAATSHRILDEFLGVLRLDMTRNEVEHRLPPRVMYNGRCPERSGVKILWNDLAEAIREYFAVRDGDLSGLTVLQDRLKALAWVSCRGLSDDCIGGNTDDGYMLRVPHGGHDGLTPLPDRTHGDEVPGSAGSRH